MPVVLLAVCLFAPSNFIISDDLKHEASVEAERAAVPMSVNARCSQRFPVYWFTVGWV